MKVLYDISVLGLVQAHPNLRTGLYRVVKNLADQLVTYPECELTFSCSVDDQMLLNCLEYSKNDSRLSHIPVSVPKLFHQKFNSFKKKKALNNERHKIIESVLEGNSGLMKTIPQKLKIRSLWLQEKFHDFYSNKSTGLINSNDLVKADIYHSPYYGIPEQVQIAKKKSVFITSYDLIPVLCPQFVVPELTAFFKKLLSSITPDTWVLCISEDCRKDLLNYMGKGINPDRVKVTELAASHNFYPSNNRVANKEVRKKYNIPDGPYVLSVGSLEPRKNIDSVIKAFVKVVQQEHIPDLNLVLVGPKAWGLDKLFAELEASALLKDRIIITGFMDDNDLAPVYSDALMFVYPSFYEGFGLPPLEAMQCGTPVITSNTSSLPEVVGDAGIMVSPTDLDALSEAMLSLYKNPALRADLSSRSLERAKKFSWERCAQETVAAYKASLK